MVKLFISYRRSDSHETTGRLYDRLIDHFGTNNVFRDIDSIPIAVPFPQFIEESLRNTDVVLVVIGTNWLSIKQPDGTRRIDDPQDFVRLEIATALRLHVPVVPVFVSNARPIDGDSLPNEIRGLAFQNGTDVRPDPDFHSDVTRLLSKLDQLLGQATPKRDTKARVDDLEKANRLLEIDLDWSRIQQNHRKSPKSMWFVTLVGIGLTFATLIAHLTVWARFWPFTLFFGSAYAVYWIYLFTRYCQYQSAYTAYLERRRRVIGRAESKGGPS